MCVVLLLMCRMNQKLKLENRMETQLVACLLPFHVTKKHNSNLSIDCARALRSSVMSDGFLEIRSKFASEIRDLCTS